MSEEGQAYYWTDEWQCGERESLEARARGETRTFGSAAEAIVWLLDDEPAPAEPGRE